MSIDLDLTGFVGRTAEVEVLRGLVAQVVAGRGRSVWVEGEPGIGKSTLLAAGLAEARPLGCRVFWCAADVSRQRLPLSVLADGLGVEVAKLLPDELVGGSTVAGDPALAMAERLLERIDRLCASAPVVLVLDDIQWADGASLSVWHRLIRAVGQLPLLLASAGRLVPKRPEVARLRRTLLDRGAVGVTLGPLSGSEVMALVGGLVGATVGPGLQAMVSGAGGNPLYVRETVAAARRDGRLRVRQQVAELTGDRSVAPVSLAAAIESRLRMLSADTGRLVRTAALLGTEFAVVDLATVAQRPVTEVAAGVDEAVAAGVLVASGDQLAFGHPMIRQALYEAIGAGQAPKLHRRAGQALARAGTPAERVAQQLLAASGPMPGWVVDWLAGVVSTLTHRAPRIAEELLTRVLDQIGVDHPRREQFTTSLVTVLRLFARYDEVERIARPALARAANPARTGQLAWTLGYALLANGKPRDALEVTDQALASRRGVDLWTARLRSLRAVVLDALCRYPESKAAAEQAIADGEQVGDRYAISFGLHGLSIGTMHTDWRQTLGHINRALAVVADDPDSADLRLVLYANRIQSLEMLGLAPEAESTLREALALAERTATPRLVTIRSAAAVFYFGLGRWDDALAELAATLELVDRRPVTNYEQIVLHGLRAVIAAHRDDRVAVRAHVTAVRGQALTSASLRDNSEYLLLARALAAEGSGHPAQALKTLARVLEPEFTRDMTARYRCLPTLVRLALAAGDPAVAGAATRASLRDMQQDPAPAKAAAAARCRGVLDADPAGLRAAADDYRTIGYLLETAETLEELAILDAKHGHTQAATTAYAEAIDLYHGLGATWDVDRANARLGVYRIGGAPHSTHLRPTTGWYALTPTELKVAHLVARGRSNPDIATELFLSRRTVQTHVSRILAKLKVGSRAEVARYATRHRSAGTRADRDTGNLA